MPTHGLCRLSLGFRFCRPFRFSPQLSEPTLSGSPLLDEHPSQHQGEGSCWRCVRDRTTIERLRGGLFGPHLDLFAADLAQLGYARETVQKQLRLLNVFDDGSGSEAWSLRLGCNYWRWLSLDCAGGDYSMV